MAPIKINTEPATNTPRRSSVPELAVLIYKTKKMFCWPRNGKQEKFQL